MRTWRTGSVVSGVADVDVPVCMGAPGENSDGGQSGLIPVKPGIGKAKTPGRRLEREKVISVLAADKKQRVPFVLCPQSTQAILTGENGEVTHSCQNYGAAAVFFTKKEPCVPDGGILAFGINLRSALNSDMFQIALRAVPEDSLKAFLRIFRRSSK